MAISNDENVDIQILKEVQIIVRTEILEAVRVICEKFTDKRETQETQDLFWVIHQKLVPILAERVEEIKK